MEESSIEKEPLPFDVGSKFNAMDFDDFVSFLRLKVIENPTVSFSVVADWVDVIKTRTAKSLLDQYASKLHIESITIMATRQQYEEDVNAFESGVKWEEV